MVFGMLPKSLHVDHLCKVRDCVTDPGVRRKAFADFAYTYRAGRQAFEHRLALIAADYRELADRLSAFLDGRDCEYLWCGRTAESSSS